MESGSLQAQLQGGVFDDYAARVEKKKAELLAQQHQHYGGADEFGQQQRSGSGAAGAMQHDNVVAPCYYKEYYDPNDPQADWSGFVEKPRGRAHFKDTPAAMKVQVAPTPDGFIMPAAEADTTDNTRTGKKKQFDVEHQKENKSGASASQMRSTENLLGGPIPLDSRYGYNRFETEAR